MIMQTSRMKLAETFSVVGAGVLGAGIALYWRDLLGPYAALFVMAGAIAHGLAMTVRHRLELAVSAPPRWVSWLYAACWIAIIAAIALGAAIRK